MEQFLSKGEKLFIIQIKLPSKTIDQDYCEATVSAKEPFYVTIEKKKMESFRSNCSCPTLASFSKDCQHIAAVLLAIHDQKKGNQGRTN